MPSEVEIGVWVGSVQKWVTGVTRRTSCHDVIKALLRAQSLPARDSDVNEYVLMERWRKVERPLDHEQRILKVWKTWGEAIQEVRFTLRRMRAEDADASDSDTGSRVERIRKRHKWKQQQQHHQQQQRQLQGIKTSSDQRHHSSSSSAVGANGAPHKKTHHDEDSKMNETMERLMRLVVAQGETIQTQLRRMQERDHQIENFEQQLHLFRVQNMGSDYLLQSYLKDPSGDAIQNPLHSEASAFVKEEEKSNDSGVVTEEPCDSDLRPSHLEKSHSKPQQSASYEELEDVRNRTVLLDKLDKVLERLLEHEEALLKLENSLTESAACELSMLEEEIATAAAVHASTVSSVRKNEQSLRELDIVLYQRRMTLDSLLEEDAKYEREALALQAHLDYIIHLPPTAFKLPEETEPLVTRFTLEASLKPSHRSSSLNTAVVPSHSSSLLPPSDILTTNAVPMIITPESKIISPKSNVSKDLLTVIPVVTHNHNNKTPHVPSSPSEVPPPLPSTSPPPLEVDEEDDKDSAKAGSLCVSSRSSTSSDSSRTPSKPVSSESSKDVDTTDSNSDTGLSSLHSSSDEGAYVFDTLV